MTAAEEALFRLAADVAASRIGRPMPSLAADTQPPPPVALAQPQPPVRAPREPVPQLEMATLATSSKGNATLVRAGSTAVLVDAGISARRLTEGLRGLGVEPASLAGIFITHEHSDHVAGLATFLKRYDVPVYANRATWEALGDVGVTYARRRIPLAAEMTVGQLSVQRFATSHDAADPSGFTFCAGRVKGAVCTDLGVVTKPVAAALAGSSLLVLEANHDPDMLRTGPYAGYLKQRIAGPQGHLANAQAARLLAWLYRGQTLDVIWAHRSATNNDVGKVQDTVMAELAREGISPAQESIHWQHGRPDGTVRMVVADTVEESRHVAKE